MSTIWYIIKSANNKRYGPYESGELVTLIREHKLLGDDYVWHQSMTNWIKVQDSELGRYLTENIDNNSLENIESQLPPNPPELLSNEQEDEINKQAASNDDDGDDEDSENDSKNENKSQPKEKHTGRNVFLTILVILAILVGVGLYFKDTIKQQLVSSLGKDEAVSIAAKTTGLSEDEINDIIDVIPEEDQQTIAKIAANHITPSTINKVIDVATADGKDGVKEYLKQELSEQEQQQLMQIANDNQEAVVQKAAEYGVDESTAKDLLPTLTTHADELKEKLNGDDGQQALQALQDNSINLNGQ